jgi:hypothetical protein
MVGSKQHHRKSAGDSDLQRSCGGGHGSHGGTSAEIRRASGVDLTHSVTSHTTRDVSHLAAGDHHHLQGHTPRV